MDPGPAAPLLKVNGAPTKTILCTGLALLAFAGNSVLCRLALAEMAIDAASFTAIRLISGVVVLTMISQLAKRKSKGDPASGGNWTAAFMLFVYALAFSFAYLSLSTGIGALILFGSVQITMVLDSLRRGKKLHYSEWMGILMAFSGFVYLVLPSLTTPSAQGFLLMMIAGIAWAIYTLLGRSASNALGNTTGNFLYTLPFVAILMVITFQGANLTPKGVVLAILSGGIASGVGYTLWYMALGGLSSVQAAVVQLLAPVIAAIGGVMFANEFISVRLLLASLLVLGGILMVILGQYRWPGKRRAGAGQTQGVTGADHETGAAAKRTGRDS